MTEARPEYLRLFIAIELPEELKRELAGLQARLRAPGDPVKWVEPAGIHLTLKFLGAVPAGRMPEINTAMSSAGEGVPPFRLALAGLGVFPSLRRVQVVWVGLKGDIETLNRLQQRLESSMAALGFPPENRPFTSHLTLARVREQATPAERQQLAEIISRTTFEPGSSFEVDSFSLMRSQLTRQGAIYSRVSLVSLRG